MLSYTRTWQIPGLNTRARPGGAPGICILRPIAWPLGHLRRYSSGPRSGRERKERLAPYRSLHLLRQSSPKPAEPGDVAAARGLGDSIDELINSDARCFRLSIGRARFGFASFGPLFRPQHALVMLQVPHRAQVAFKRPLGIERRLTGGC